MKTIEILCDHIDEELEDARNYVQLAIEYKHSDPEVAQTFYKLSLEEMTHMDMLHKSVVAHIDNHKKSNGEAPIAMTSIYEYLHKKYIDKSERISSLQAMYRNS